MKSNEKCCLIQECCIRNIFQKVLNANEHQNTVVSSFLVKLLLSILAEAAGLDTITRRELLTVLPSIRTEEETRELYGRTFGSLLASHSRSPLL